MAYRKIGLAIQAQCCSPVSSWSEWTLTLSIFMSCVGSSSKPLRGYPVSFFLFRTLPGMPLTQLSALKLHGASLEELPCKLCQVFLRTQGPFALPPSEQEDFCMPCFQGAGRGKGEWSSPSWISSRTGLREKEECGGLRRGEPQEQCSKPRCTTHSEWSRGLKTVWLQTPPVTVPREQRCVWEHAQS